MTAWQRHVADWKDCTRCSLHVSRNKVVLARGKVPCDVLFVGEAPGISENSIGQPFVGPAGHKLDGLIADALNMLTNAGHGCAAQLRLAFTNLICCIPYEKGSLSKVEEPPVDSIEACQPRLLEFVDLCEPSLIITVGSWADDFMPRSAEGVKWCSIIHPAAILRANRAQQSMMEQRVRVILANAMEKLI